MAKYGTTPPLIHLKDDTSKALLIALRESVKPILSNNILPHFTDHSVLHSDGVTRRVDSLIVPLQETKAALSDQELVVLYSACYLHDIGLQYQNAGDTKTIAKLNRESWHLLSVDERQSLLRKHHHQISAEMVHSSVHATDPIVGIQLTDAYHPSEIACLCEAHNLILENQKDKARYAKLTQYNSRFRMDLLGGLLRVADILEETRDRATRPKANTLMLDMESQKHWWRHYYTADVVFHEGDRTITIWFDFPPDKIQSYAEIVPKLQVPWIEAEFERHKSVLNKYGVYWTLKAEMKSSQYSNTEEMPDEVIIAMEEELRGRHSQTSTRHGSDHSCMIPETRIDPLTQAKEALSSTEQQNGEWTEQELTELREEDKRSRQPLIDFAVNALNKDKKSVEILFKVLDLKEGESRDASRLVELLFPRDLEENAADEEVPATLDSLLKIAHRLDGTLPDPTTLYMLRDVAIGLSIPRKYRIEALRQYMQEKKIRHLPTVDIGISKQILCRAMKLMSNPASQRVANAELHARFICREKVLDVEVGDILHLVGKQPFVDVQEPAGASLKSSDFLLQFCQGLAKALRVSFDESDKNEPPGYYRLINVQLGDYNKVGVTVCVFLTLARSDEEINKIREWFELLEIVRVTEREPWLFKALRKRIDNVDDLLHDQFGPSGTTDIV